MAIDKKKTNDEKRKNDETIMTVLMKAFFIIVLMTLTFSAYRLVLWFQYSDSYEFKKIELVNKLENQQAKELQTTATNLLEGGFFSLDIDEFSSQLVAKLAWVKQVTVKKVWPDKLLIKIAERKPLVRWLAVEEDNEMKLLSQYGVIFSPLLTIEQTKKFSNLVLFTGVKNKVNEVMTQCLLIHKKLADLGFDIKQCGIDKRKSWSVILLLDNSQAISLKLGKNNMQYKLIRFVKIFSGQLKKYIEQIDSADLRYENGFSVQWKPLENIETNN